MNRIINRSNPFKRIKLLAILFALLFLPQAMWAVTETKTYIFTSSTPIMNGETVEGGTLECNGVTTWNLQGAEIDEYKEIGPSTSQSEPMLNSVDWFHKVNKITVNITIPDMGGDTPYVQLLCNGDYARVDGSGTKDIVFTFSDEPFFYPEGPIAISIYSAFPEEFILNSISVEYEKNNIGMSYRSLTSASIVTEWSIDWTQRGEASFPEADPTAGDYISGLVTYSSSNESVATIKDNGSITIVSPGVTTIKASYSGYSEMNAEDSAKYVLTVVDDRYDADYSYSAATAEVTYGSTISLPTLLNPDLFPVTYSSSNVNVATVNENGDVTLVSPGQTTISANYEGDNSYKPKSASYVLTYHAKTLTDDMITVNPESVSFNGSNQVPTVTVKDGTTNLIKDTDYTLDNPGGKLAGNYPVIITGKGNYTGTINKSFAINDMTAKYDIWINGNQVSAANCEDVLSDSVAGQKPASFIYNPNNNFLIVNSTGECEIETQISSGLTIYLAPKSESRVSQIIYTGKSNATLTFTTDGNNPGRLILDNTHANAPSPVISGFSQLVFDEKQNIGIISPEGITYQNNQLNVSSAIIGVPMSPITKKVTIQPNGAEIVPEAGESDINKVVDDILYTLGDTTEPDGDGFDDGGFIVINTVTSDHQAAEAVKDYTPGTEDFMEHLKGMTFIVPAGNGTIKLDLQTMDAHILKVKIGDAVPTSIEKRDRGEVEIPYNVGKPTYVYLYNGGPSSASARNKTISKGGKKTVTHIRVYKVGINPNKVKTSNSVGEASDGVYTGDTSDMEGQEIISDDDLKAHMGDVNGDGVQTASDIVEMVKAISGMHSGVFDATNADMNGDGVINISDIIQIIHKIE